MKFKYNGKSSVVVYPFGALEPGVEFSEDRPHVIKVLKKVPFMEFKEEDKPKKGKKAVKEDEDCVECPKKK